MLENLNTVHGLTQEIKRLRDGEEDGHTPEMKLTPGQLWKRLLELPRDRRIEMVRSLLESADEGARCSMEMHQSDLEYMRRRVDELAGELLGWRRSRRLLTVYLGHLRKDQEGKIERGTMADKLELFIAGGDSPARPVICDHTWSEAGREFECAEPVGPDGTHLGNHHAYVEKGSAADEELRMTYLEQENDALRSRLGLAPNPRRA